MSKPLRFPFPWLVAVSLVMLLLSACASRPREGPPAPVVSVTSRPTAPAPQPTEETTAKPKPVAPVKQQTRTYAYQEPGTEPPPEETPQTTPTTAPGQEAQPSTTAPGSQSPAAVAQKPPASTTAPARSPEPQAAPKPPVPPTASVPKAPAPKPQAAPAAPPAPETRVASAAPAVVAPPAPEEKPLTPTLPPAADGLARQAEQQRQQGDYAGAAATLERSLRIAPREAYLWNRLARVRMEQGLTAQAGQLAARSNDLAGSQANIKRDNWRIIAESRRRAGDVTGAGEAEKRASGG